MKTDLYKTLNASAKSWWYHRDLRKCGNTAEARKRERQSIKSDLEAMRLCLKDDCAHIHIGAYGVSINYRGQWGTVSHQGYSLDHVTIAVPLMAMGVRALDSRPMENPACTIRFPLVASATEGYGAPDPAPYHSLSRAPFEYVADLYRQHGGAVINA